jgi:uncharacterized membrane protein YgaE (UPF0421/DUF939 family)
MRRDLEWARIGSKAVQRVRAGWPAVALAAISSALAWVIAHRLLGHRQPFFAPIAAAISLSTSRIQRSRRIAQMVAGVLLGIAIGDLLTSLLGSSTVALGAIVFVTMTLALASGVGFFGEGLMFANQAAASAILVTTVHRAGTGFERGADALVGGGVALVVGVVLFPAEPVSLLRDAERSALEVIARILEQASEQPSAPTAPEEAWVVGASHQLHQQLSSVARARATARANVRVAPRRWQLRAKVDAEIGRLAQLDLLANTALGLARTVSTGAGPASDASREHVAALAHALGVLARSPRPLPRGSLDALRESLPAVARTPRAAERTLVVDAAVQTAITDVLRVLESEPAA